MPMAQPVTDPLSVAREEVAALVRAIRLASGSPAGYGGLERFTVTFVTGNVTGGQGRVGILVMNGGGDAGVRG
jgi:hypothetical protein